jgi:predicted rRNA methylase YqxC with S4 and FtsJ domains
VVRDPAKHLRVVERINVFGARLGLAPVAERESPIQGAKGNKEIWVLFET